MKDRLESFVSSYESFTKLTKPEVVLGFAYFLTISEGKKDFVVKDIKKCYTELKITSDPKVVDHLRNYSNRCKTAPRVFFEEAAGRYSLSPVGYRRCRKLFRELPKKPPEVPKKTKPAQNARTQLESLTDGITDPAQIAFLEETIKCYNAGAYRATIVMMWALAIDHLRLYILANKLEKYNQAYSASTNKRIQHAFGKTEYIEYIEDFVELDDSIFIELCGIAGVVRKNTKGTLERCLKKRNQAAHPNTVTFTQEIVIAHIQELVHDVIEKLPL